MTFNSMFVTLLFFASLSLGRETCVVDEATRDPALLTVRGQLIKALMTGPIFEIANLISPDIELSLGGLSGRKEFFALMQKPAKRRALLEALSLGGRFEQVRGQDYFWAPFSFTEPRDGVGEHRVVALVRPLPVLGAPRANAHVVANLTCGPIMVDQEAEGRAVPGWIPVRVGGQTGFVATSMVRSPTDYRVGLIRTSEGWRVLFFVAGD